MRVCLGLGIFPNGQELSERVSNDWKGSGSYALMAFALHRQPTVIQNLQERTFLCTNSAGEFVHKTE